MRISIWHLRATGTACALLAIAACQPVAQTQPAQPAESSAQTPAPASQSAQVEVATPRPDLYSQRALGAWDGRPSLGGAWIAHPDVTTAERASITEVATGRTITAALFRRDPLNPGPPFQLSADAAQQLGIQPGVSVELDVVALRMTTVTTPQAAPTTEIAAEQPAPQIEEAAAPAPEPVAQPVVAEQPEPTPAPAPEPASGPAPERPYMQVGTFGVAANATALVERLRAQGLNAQTVAAGELTRVLVGPAGTAAEQAIMRDTLREMGFTDALAVAL